MASFIPFTEEQKIRAASVNLKDFLERNGVSLKKSGREFRLEADPYITVNENEWYDQSEMRGGNPISFVKQFYNVNYQDAMKILLEGEHLPDPGFEDRPKPIKEKKPFALPTSHRNMRGVFGYLIKQRHIPAEIISHFVKAGLLYESAEPSKDGSKLYRNAVFVGKDENGVARHAHQHSIFSKGGSFKGNVESSEPEYSFHHIGTSDRLYAFEAPIDMLSFIALYSNNWQRHNYVALCGLSEHSIVNMLQTYPHIEKTVLCLDHDERGIEGAGRLMDMLNRHTTAVQLPEYKDWNEEWKAHLGLPAEPGQEHPQIVLFHESVMRLARQMQEGIADEPLSRSAVLNQTQQLVRNIDSKLVDQAKRDAGRMVSHWLRQASDHYHKLGILKSSDELCFDLESRFAPHRNRMGAPNQASELQKNTAKCIEMSGGEEPISDAQRHQIAEMCMGNALGCAKLAVRIHMDELAMATTEVPTQTMA